MRRAGWHDQSRGASRDSHVAGRLGAGAIMLIAATVVVLGPTLSKSAGASTPQPTVSSVAPNQGSPDGGTAVTISGTGFTGATAVDFGLTPASMYTIVSDTTITAISPAGPEGAVDVTVTTPAGTSLAVRSSDFSDAFIYGPIATYSGLGIGYPRGTTTGPDGALWFANGSTNSIGRITTSGVVSNYTGTGIDNPFDITAGPDGALWFTNSGNNSIGSITTSGVVSNYTGIGIGNPYAITSGPDGALWFTNPGSNSIGRITTSGVVTNYTGTGVDDPLGITSGPDGALWFTNSNGSDSSIGSITTSGVVTIYTETGDQLFQSASPRVPTGTFGSPTRTGTTTRSVASRPRESSPTTPKPASAPTTSHGPGRCSGSRTPLATTPSVASQPRVS